MVVLKKGGTHARSKTSQQTFSRHLICYRGFSCGLRSVQSTTAYVPCEGARFKYHRHPFFPNHGFMVQGTMEQCNPTNYWMERDNVLGSHWPEYNPCLGHRILKQNYQIHLTVCPKRTNRR